VKLVHLADSELPQEVRAIIDEMVESNREDVSRIRRAFAPKARAVETAHDDTVVPTEHPGSDRTD
jgi:hypothetical protein